MTNVVIDCDPGIDDALALMYAIKNPDFNVKAITIVSGNVNATKGMMNAQYILHILDREDIPIYIGRTSETYIDAEDTHGYNGLGNYDYGNVELVSLCKESADEYLASISEEDEITLIALGPLTNIWKAYCLNPNLFHNLYETVIMGGAYRTYGNCTPVSEYNFWCDPVSAKKVFEVMQNATIVPLDVTRKIVLTPEKIQAIKEANWTIGCAVEKITAYYIDFHRKQEGIYGCIINDPVAVFVADGYLYTKSFYALVSDNMDVTRGQMIVDAGNIYHKDFNCHIATSIPPDAVDLFWATFIKTICS